MWKGFQALPPYLGGKRKLTGKIMKEAQGELFVDDFMGGGSVSLFAKAKGYKVIANDFAIRCLPIAEGILKNNELKITKQDILFLLQDAESDHFIENKYVPDLFIIDKARILDRIWQNIQKLEGLKKQLLTLLFVDYICFLRPFGEFNNKKVTQSISKDETENLFQSKDNGTYQRYVKNNLNANEDKREILIRTDAEFAQKNLQAQEKFVREGQEGAFDFYKKKQRINSTYHVLMDIANKINRGIFSNGKKHEFYQLDVFEFLKLPEVQKADTIYFDPPYYGCSNYEEHLEVLDFIINRKIDPKEPSCFNKDKWIFFIEELIRLSKDIPTIIFSFGGPNADKEQLKQIMLKYKKKVKDLEIKYWYPISAKAKEAHVCKELLLIGT